MFKSLSACILTSLVLVAPARALSPTEELSKCLVATSTQADRTVLLRWLVAAATTHPDVADMATLAPEKLDAANRDLAVLFVRLLSESCAKQARAAMKADGATAIQKSFELLGQVAGEELFTSPDVQKSLSGIDKHIDAKKLTDALGPTPEK
jgi:hypothetical protein